MSSHFASNQSLSGRRILITGASSGLGESIAGHLAGLGCQIVAVGRDQQRLTNIVSKLAGEGHEQVIADLASRTGLEILSAVISSQEEMYGFVHCAGTQVIKPLRSLKSQDFNDQFDIHVVAAAEIMKMVANKIGRNGHGSFVLLSSVSAFRGGAGVGAYAVAKAAVVALARIAALELVGQRIRVNCLVPGMVPTEMSNRLIAKLPESRRHEVVGEHPLGLGSPDDVAQAVEFLLSDSSSWITGDSIPVDGGFLAR